VEPEAACGTTVNHASIAAPSTETWFANPATQPQRRDDIERELENWGGAVAGTYLDDALRAFVIVLHADFVDYDGLRQKLEPISPPLKVVLRPACYSRSRIEEARRVLEDKAWHPQAGASQGAWIFDARFSAFSVGLETSPEVAKALRERLGPLAQVSLNGPTPSQRRHTPARRPR
jgi:hypothetical protein